MAGGRVLQLSLDLSHCQRWRRRRDTYRPAGEPIRVSRYGVALLDEQTAKRFIVEHHYSGSYPAARCRVGLFEVGAGLVGVLVFGVPMQPAAVRKHLRVEASEGVELSRLVLLDRVPANGETWFLGQAFRRLQEEKPGVRAVLSYADPVPRTTTAGRTVKPGHVGTIYQAHNGVHVGHSSARTLLLAPDGTVISARAISKLRAEDRGQDYAEAQLARAGCPARRSGESGAAYVERVTPALRRLKHPGNIAYAWGLDRRTRRGLPPPLPYPKQPPTRCGGTPPPLQQTAATS